MGAHAERMWQDAVRDVGIEPPPRVRPNPLLWLRYVVWLPLPERYRGWVLYDTTCATWMLRHFARLLAAAALPVAAIAIWLPASGNIRALTALVTGLCAVLFPGIYINEATDHRIIQAGWPASVAPRIRELRGVYTQRSGNAARRDSAAARRARRGR